MFSIHELLEDEDMDRTIVGPALVSSESLDIMTMVFNRQVYPRVLTNGTDILLMEGGNN